MNEESTHNGEGNTCDKFEVDRFRTFTVMYLSTQKNKLPGNPVSHYYVTIVTMQC